jgi:glycerol kinase
MIMATGLIRRKICCRSLGTKSIAYYCPHWRFSCGNFGEGCFEKGTAKATLGTGCSIMSNIGNEPLISSNGMLTTVCWSVEGRVDYAFEGAIVSCGSTIEWLKNEMKFFTHPSETEDLAQK